MGRAVEYTLTVDTKLPTSPTAVAPTKPYADPIEWLHRGNDGWVPFAKLDERGQFHHLYSLPANRLPTIFDTIADDLEKDSYFGVHAMIHAGAKKNPHHPTLPRAMRRAEKVKYLNAAWVDLDFYNLGMELHEVIAAVVYLQHHGVIPPASFFADSGRGLWVFWLLQDAQTGHGPRAWPPNKEVWAKVQGSLYRRFAEYGADKQARDLARVTRVPGSINTKVNRRVSCWVQLDRTGDPFMYSLPELRDALGVTADPPTPLEVKVNAAPALPAIRPPMPEWDGVEKTKWGSRKGGPLSLRAKNAHNQRWIHSLNDFRTLRAMRGGFSAGCRNHAALVYAMLLWRHRLPHEDVYLEVAQLGRECLPPLTEHQVKNAVNQARKYQKIHNAEIADLLLVQPHEAELLARWPPMGTPRPAIKPKVRNAARDARRAIIDRIVGEMGQVPPLRELLARVHEEGMDASLDTIKRDLAGLRLTNPRRRKVPTGQDSLF